MTDALKQFILSHRREDGFIEGRLSSSAVSTAVACVALDLYGGHDDAVSAGRQWLLTHRNPDGLYGDSPESPANLTATFLAYSALRNSHVNGVRDFLSGCFRPTGLFAAVPADPFGDLEYTVYGLLAMGATA